MKKVEVKAFFKRISEEIPKTRFEWWSVVASDPSNAIYAEVVVERGSIITLNKSAINVYGDIRSIRDIYQYEYVEKLTVKRTLSGPILSLETYL